MLMLTCFPVVAMLFVFTGTVFVNGSFEIDKVQHEK